MPTSPTIVVATDFSETSIEALNFACETARQQQAHLHILHVVPDARMEPWALEASRVDLNELNQNALADARRRMADLPSCDLPADRVTRAVVLGSIPGDINRYAREHDATLLVVGTHGYGPVRRFLLGSVATRVLREAPCPVVTVPPRWLKAGHDAPAVA